jgi:hypothetical protein
MLAAGFVTAAMADCSCTPSIRTRFNPSRRTFGRRANSSHDALWKDTTDEISGVDRCVRHYLHSTMQNVHSLDRHFGLVKH